jgi:hypothetical protein
LKAFHQTYPLLSTARTFAATGIFLALAFAAFVVMNCFEPKMDVSCARAEKATCTLHEYTWLSSTGPTTVDLETTRFEVERRSEAQKLYIRRVDGGTAFHSDLSKATARAVKAKTDAFRADPSAKSVVFHEEFPSWIFLVMVPLLVPLSLVPSWILGGKLSVEAEPGRISVTRARFLWKHRTDFAFPLGELPSVEAKMVRFHKHKRQGVLLAKASTGSTTPK